MGDKMKKIFLICSMLLVCLFMSGCGNSPNVDVVKKIKDNIEGSNNYYLTGKLELLNSEDIYKYDIQVSYKKDNNFKVYLKNTINNHEQVILRNKDGVYVLTPALNKSFKFQSEWPYNNSQSYLLQSLLKDMENENVKVEEKNNMYIITTPVNYSNNKELVNQQIIVTKDYEIKEVNVFDENNNVSIKMSFDMIDLNKSFNDEYFNLENNQYTTDVVNTVSKIENITYPLYIPSNTYLSDKQVLEIDDGERVILTFAGESPFMLIQETATKQEEFTTIPVYGEPYLFADSVGTLSEQSVSWISNGIEYYVTSETLDKEELLNVAKSMGSLPVANVK